MYHIGICDDEEYTCSELEEMVMEICSELNIKANINIWYSGKNLLSHIEAGAFVDLLFLDIGLPDTDGIDIGQHIRDVKKNNLMQIAYISSRESYAMELFQNQPVAFLIKPIKKDKVTDVIQKGISRKKNTNYSFAYKKGRDTYIIDCNDIVYFESVRKQVGIMLKDKKIAFFYGKLGDVSKVLPDNFSIIHKSCIVNRDYIKCYNSDAVLMSNDKSLAISKPYRDNIKCKIQRDKEGGIID
jgi:DNA-binding LytR/AlgR family response regulator